MLLGRAELAISASVITGTPRSPLAPAAANARPKVSLREGAMPAALFGGSLVEWWQSRRGAAPDLCLFVHPRFDERSDFWAGLRALLASGVRVGCLARGIEETGRDAWLLRAYGYEAVPRPKANPWAKRRSESLGHGAWGAVGWELVSAVLPGADFPVDAARLARAREAQQFLQHEYEV